MKFIALLILASLLPGMSSAATSGCSIHAGRHADARQLAALAKVSRAKATTVALDAVKTKRRKVLRSAELEAEHGCLIWSFDIGVTGSAVTHEVAVDAGDARVLSITTENAAQEADEARRETR